MGWVLSCPECGSREFTEEGVCRRCLWRPPWLRAEERRVEELYDELYECWFRARKILGRGIGLIEQGRVKEGIRLLNELRELMKMTDLRGLRAVMEREGI